MMERIEKPDIIDIIEKKRLQWYGHVKRFQRREYQNELRREGKEDAQEKCVWTGTSSHDNKKFRKKSM